MVALEKSLLISDNLFSFILVSKHGRTLEENKNLEGQGQQNQDPDNTPEEKEPTVEELMAQLAQERANSAKLQNDYNKASSEAANYRKQLKAKQTAEEQEEEAKREAEEEHKKYVQGLENTIKMTNATNRYLALGMSGDMAKDTAQAELDGDMVKVTENMSKFKDASIKEAETEWLKSRPPVNAGQGEDEETDLFLKGFNG